jgi:hypothetical protein
MRGAEPVVIGADNHLSFRQSLAAQWGLNFANRLS